MGLVRQIVNRLLQPVEYLLAARLKEGDGFPPVYIVGPPRSGSTLLMQVMVRYFEFGYLSNFSRNFFRVPLVGAYLDKRFRRTGKGYELTSDYGVTTGLFEPSEAADFWYTWFPDRKDIYTSALGMPEAEMESFGRMSRRISAVYGAPLIHKNLYNSLRIRALSTADSQALFIVMIRDVLQTAQSIYQARLRKNGGAEDWWSVPPPEVAAIQTRQPPVQVVQQVYYIYRQIFRNLEKYSGDRYFLVSYEDFCRSPGSVLSDFKTWAQKHGITLQESGAALPELKVSTGQTVPDDVYQAMQTAFHEIEQQEGPLFGK